MSNETETKALEMGWVPKDEFRGDPEKWIDAETYVRRGEEFMPILKANNKRLSEELAQVKGELKKTNEMLAASTESIEALREFNSDLVRKEAEKQIAAMKVELKEAKQEGDVDKELELTEQIREHSEALKEAKKEPAKKVEQPPVQDPTQNPEWQAWVAENTWFGKDKRRTALAIGIAEEIKDAENIVGRALLDRVSEEVEKVFGGGAPRHDKVEGGGRGAGNGGGGGKSFADLPAEAKEACDRQANRLVGDNRAFKTMQDWRKHYTKQYFGEA